MPMRTGPGQRPALSSLWGGPGPFLPHVRAAQLRARITKRALVRVLLGMVFLIGAISYALAPDRHEQASLAWMSGLLIGSTLDVALGSRTLARLRRLSPAVWMCGTAAWGVLATSLVAFLLRR